MQDNVQPKVDVVFVLTGDTYSAGFLNSFVSTMDACRTKGMKAGVAHGTSCNIYVARNNALSGNLNLSPDQQKMLDGLDYDTMIWIDSDITFTPNDVFNLLESKEVITAGIYRMINNQLSAGSDWRADKYLTKEELDIANGHLIEVEFTGFGLIAIKKGVFEKLSFPWFDPFKTPYAGGSEYFATDDVSFCIKAKEAGFKIFIDPRVCVLHEKTVVLSV